MIGILDIQVQAANPQLPLAPIRAYKNSPTSVRVRNVPKAIGSWKITSVQIVALYPDNVTKTADCVLVGGVWVGTIAGCDRAGKTENGFTVFASGIDENGNVVSNYVLGKGLVEILDGDGTLVPNAPSYFVHLLSAESSNPKDGDVWQTNGAWYIYQDGQSWPIGDDSGLIGQLSAELSAKQDALTEQQISAIDSVVDERKTIFTINGQGEVAVDVVGELSSSHIPAQGYLLRGVRIGTAVTSIANSTFSTKAIDTLTIPNTVKHIGDFAFVDCHELRGTLVIPDGVETIGEYAFAEANNLDTIEIPSSVKTIGRQALLASAPRIIFKGRTIEEVKAMSNYPWGTELPEIDNTDRVTVYATEKEVASISSDVSAIQNVVPSQASPSNQLADKIWVGDKVDSLETRIESGALVARYATSATTATSALSATDAVNASNATSAISAQNLTNLNYVRHLDYSKPQEILGFVDRLTSGSGTPHYLTKQTQISETVWSWEAWSGSDSYKVYLDLTDSENPIFGYGQFVGTYYTTFTIPNGATSFSTEYTLAGYSFTLTLLTEDTIALRNDNISQFRNDVDYITSEQVKPWGSGWALRARQSMDIVTEQFLIGGTGTYPCSDLSSLLQFQFGWVGHEGGAARILTGKKAPWVLSALTGTSFDPPIEMTWGYNTITQKRNGRVSQVYTGAGWKSPLINETTTYLINSDCSRFYTLTGNPTSTGYYSGSSYKAITLASDEKSIETYNGQTDQISCTRADTGMTSRDVRYLAFEDQLSAKADVSALTAYATTADLSTKQDALTEEQIAAIDSVVDERQTVIKYVNGDVVSLDISGTIENSDLSDVGNIQEIKFGTTVTELGDFLIDYAAPLTKIEIPDSVSSIGEHAFRSCGNLSSVKIGNGLIKIDEGAFGTCSFSTLELPESMKIIDNGAFSNNQNLTAVYIPKYVDSIGYSICWQSPNAKLIFLDRTMEEVMSIGGYPWTDASRIYAIDSTDSYEFCTITPPAPCVDHLLFPITYSIQGVGYTVEGESKITIVNHVTYYTVVHNNTTLGSPIILFNADKTGAIESFGSNIDEGSMRFNEQIISEHSNEVLNVPTTYQLKNKAVNTINVSTDLQAKYDLRFPTAIGRARDFSTRVVATSGTYSTTPYLTFPNGVTLMNTNGQMPAIATDISATKTTLIHFSEIAENTFLINGESLQTITS